MGWTPHTPLRAGVSFGVVATFSPAQWQHTHSRLLEALERACWGPAAAHPDGGGLQQGAVLDPARAFVEKLRRAGDRASAGLLEVAVAGGWWPESRRHSAGYRVSPTCQRCHSQPETLQHAIWLCPANAAITHPAVLATQELIPRATAPDAVACLWQRAIVARSSLPPIPPPSTGCVRTAGAVPACAVPHLVFGTDGSGGAHSNRPELRRCGWSWAAIDPVSLRYVGGEWGPLPGALQSVPRAEHFALRQLASFLAAVSEGCEPHAGCQLLPAAAPFHSVVSAAVPPVLPQRVPMDTARPLPVARGHLSRASATAPACQQAFTLPVGALGGGGVGFALLAGTARAAAVPTVFTDHLPLTTAVLDTAPWRAHSDLIAETRADVSRTSGLALWHVHSHRAEREAHGAIFPHVPLPGVLANEAADVLAEHGASVHAVPPPIVAAYEAEVALATTVAQRMAPILRVCAAWPVDPLRVSIPPPPPRRFTRVERLRIGLRVTSHSLIHWPQGFACRRCFSRAALRDAVPWLLRPCSEVQEPPARGGPHPSHQMRVGGTVLYCTRCAAWSQGSFRGLGKHCTATPPPFAAYVLRRLQRGLRPVPHAPPLQLELEVIPGHTAPAPGTAPIS